jgi:hypothetical protein
VLDNVDVAQAHVHLLGPAAEEGPAVQQASKCPRRVNRPPSGERRQVDRPPVVETEVPVAVRVADPECARAAERDGNAQQQFLPHAIEWVWKGFSPKTDR